MHDTMTAPRELAFRLTEGIEVSLLWYEGSDQLVVSVLDLRTGQVFALFVGDENPLDVFHHPYWYAAQRTASTTVENAPAARQ
jgi:hypothetical protein